MQLPTNLLPGSFNRRLLGWKQGLYLCLRAIALIYPQRSLIWNRELYPLLIRKKQPICLTFILQNLWRVPLRERICCAILLANPSSPNRFLILVTSLKSQRSPLMLQMAHASSTTLVHSLPSGGAGTSNVCTVYFPTLKAEVKDTSSDQQTAPTTRVCSLNSSKL